MAKYKIIPSSRNIVQSPISIGHKAEKGVEAIEFDLTAWVETYGSGTLTVIMRRWGDAIPYPIALEIDENNKATWALSDTDTARAGMAYAQLSYIVGETVVKKSDIYTFRVMDSLTGEGEPPEAYESWLEHLQHLAAEAMAEVLDIEGVATDKTLTVDGGIADAKATGDALSALEGQFTEETDQIKADLNSIYYTDTISYQYSGVKTFPYATVQGGSYKFANTGNAGVQVRFADASNNTLQSQTISAGTSAVITSNYNADHINIWFAGESTILFEDYTKRIPVIETGLLSCDGRITNLSNAQSIIEIDLANAELGGYLYDTTAFRTATSYKYAKIDVRGFKKVHLIGTTANAFCLYKFIDTWGNTISYATKNTAETDYDIVLDVPLTAVCLLFTYNFSKAHSCSLYTTSNSFIKTINPEYSFVHNVQKSIAEDWCFPFIDVGGLGLGYKHIIPGTAKIWSSTGTKDLNQISSMLSDGVHPFFGDGVVLMYGASVARQIALVPPKYTSADSISDNMWNGKSMLWLGTSIPAGSDPSAGAGQPYPSIVANQLGATVINNARGSSCVRINSSQGDYNNMYYPHFLRSLSRTLAEVDDIVANWATIQPQISGAPSTLSDTEVATMRSHSFENLLLPYLDGTQTMPDAFIIDHGHNDKRPKGGDGGYDMYIDPSYENIMIGKVAVDTWMTANNYANLKTALNSDISGVENLSQFASTLNRNTFKGAMNFIITLILRYNPRARIIIISDYH